MKPYLNDTYVEQVDSAVEWLLAGRLQLDSWHCWGEQQPLTEERSLTESGRGNNSLQDCCKHWKPEEAMFWFKPLKETSQETMEIFGVLFAFQGKHSLHSQDAFIFDGLQSAKSFLIVVEYNISLFAVMFLGPAVGQVFTSFGNWSNLDVNEYNCSVNNIIRGHWYSR